MINQTPWPYKSCIVALQRSRKANDHTDYTVLYTKQHPFTYISKVLNWICLILVQQIIPHK